MNAGMSKHRPDIVSLVFGGLFLSVVTWWLFTRFVDVQLSNAGWIIGAALITAGGFGLWTTLWPDRHRSG
jgi:hypothetical protein